ncbi:MAG: DegV family protein [Clostridiales bacterium]|nr:DegV family protein [Clostridiales bacterium]
MNKVKVITDSCSDLGKELRDKYGMDYALMSIVWDDKEIPASTDGDLFSFKEMYDALRAGKRIITQQVSAAEFERVFSLYLEQGMDVVYVSLSSAMSGSYNIGQVVAKQLMEKYPGREVICVDPKNSCLGEGIVAIEAAKVAATGAGVAEVAKAAENAAKYAMQFCTVESLEYFKRAGRVKASAAFFGNLFGIKPIIINSHSGELEAVKKIKGRKKSLDECVDMLVKSIGCDAFPVEEQTVYVAHADCEQDANYLADAIRAKINPKDIVLNLIGPTVGATAGPGAISLCAFGNQYATLGE